MEIGQIPAIPVPQSGPTPVVTVFEPMDKLDTNKHFPRNPTFERYGGAKHENMYERRAGEEARAKAAVKEASQLVPEPLSKY